MAANLVTELFFFFYAIRYITLPSFAFFLNVCLPNNVGFQSLV